MSEQRKATTIIAGAGTAKSGSCSEDSVYAAIHNAVLDHRLPPGTKLTESVFSKYFHVSRTVIRKALFRLAQKNIVELRPNRGAIIARPSIDETRDIFKARCIIEKAIIEEVAGNIDKDGIKRLRQHLQAEKIARDKREKRTIVRLSGEFHILLAGLQSNRVLAEYLAELVSRTTLIIALYESTGTPGCSNHDHHELIAAIAEKDVARAVTSMHAHLLEIESNLNLEENTGEINLEEIFRAD